MQYKLTKVALAVVAFNTTIYFDQAESVDYLDEQSSFTQISEGLSTGWHWGLNKANAAWQESQDYGNGTTYGRRPSEDFSFYGNDYNYYYYDDYDGGGGGGGGGSNSTNPTPIESAPETFDKEIVMDSIVALKGLKSDLTKALSTANLTKEGKEAINETLNKLNKAIDKGNVYLNVGSGLIQGNMHLAENSYKEAIAELAGIGAALGINIIISGPIAGVLASFAAAFVAESSTEILLDALEENSGVTMRYYKRAPRSIFSLCSLPTRTHRRACE